MKNTKLFWRLSGCFLMAALFLGFGSGSLRAQDTYKRITSTTELTEGEYLIICDSVTTEKKNDQTVETVCKETFSTYAASNGFNNLTIAIDNGSVAATAATEADDAAHPHTVTLTKKGDKWYITETVSGKYLCITAKNKLNLQENNLFEWTITFQGKYATLAGELTGQSKDSDNGTYDIRRNGTTSTASPFRVYKADGQLPVSLYKKQGTAPEPPVSDAASLSVTLSGAMQGTDYTTAKPVTFAFATAHFTLGTDGKVKYYILDGEGDEAADGSTAESSYSQTFEPGSYTATFELVDGQGNSLDPKVEVEKEFTVIAADPDTPEPPVSGDLFYEPFDKVTGKDEDISDKMDTYTELAGWTAQKVFTNNGNVRVGSSGNAGWIQTPALDLSANGGRFVLSFDAQAYDNNNEKDNFKLTVNGEEKEVSGLSKSEMTSFEYTFTNGTAQTRIKFEALVASKNRFYLDNIRVKAAAAEEPDAPALNVVPASLSLSTVQGTPVSKKVSVTGRNLTADVAVSCPEGNFSVSPATLGKEDVMGEGGAELTVTFNGEKAADNVAITLASGNLSKTLAVTATATQVTEVDDLAALRGKEADGSTAYTVKGEVVVTAVDGTSTWVQDASAAILIYGATGQQYQVGDGITGIHGTLKNYNDLVELIPGGDQPEAGTHGNKVEPQVMTVKELNEAGAANSSRLIRLNGLSLDSVGAWVAGKNYVATDEAGNEITIRTTLTKGSYIGEALPEGRFDLVALAGIFKGTVQVSPRVKEDIVTDGNGGGNGGGNEEDDCQAPTSLKVSVFDNSATLSWNGETAIYRVAVLLGKDTVCNETVATRTHSLKALQAGTYSWAVASVCDNDDEKWTSGEAFEVKVSTANEASEGLECRIYPNPTAGVFYVEVAENARMEIFTLGGVVLRSEELTAGRNEVRLDASGIYFIRLTSGSAATVKRVVVR